MRLHPADEEADGREIDGFIADVGDESRYRSCVAIESLFRISASRAAELASSSDPNVRAFGLQQQAAIASLSSSVDYMFQQLFAHLLVCIYVMILYNLYNIV